MRHGGELAGRGSLTYLGYFRSHLPERNRSLPGVLTEKVGHDRGKPDVGFQDFAADGHSRGQQPSTEEVARPLNISRGWGAKSVGGGWGFAIRSTRSRPSP